MADQPRKDEMCRIASELCSFRPDGGERGFGAFVYFDILSEGGFGTRQHVLTVIDKWIVSIPQDFDDLVTEAAVLRVAVARREQPEKVSAPRLELGDCMWYAPMTIVNVVKVFGPHRTPSSTKLSYVTIDVAARFIAQQRDYGMYDIKLSYSQQDEKGERAIEKSLTSYIYEAVARGSALAGKLRKVKDVKDRLRNGRSFERRLAKEARDVWRVAILATIDDLQETLEEQDLIAELHKALRASASRKPGVTSKRPTRLITLDDEE